LVRSASYNKIGRQLRAYICERFVDRLAELEDLFA